MSLARDLLEQAVHLTGREPKRPRQASLRRAISAAYYALFHHLIDEASRFLVRGRRDGLRQVARRAFAHAEMRSVCKAFASGAPNLHWARLLHGPVPADLRLVAEIFHELQGARHEADYDLSRSYARQEVGELVMRARIAFAAWARCRTSPAAEVFMTALLLDKRPMR
jgi:hypothetical protein